jgi:hypothetical protein
LKHLFLKGKSRKTQGKMWFSRAKTPHSCVKLTREKVPQAVTPAPAFAGTGSGGSPARLEFSGFPTKPFGDDSSIYTGTIKRPVMHPEKSKAVGIKPHDLLQNVRINKKTVGPLEAGPRFR